MPTLFAEIAAILIIAAVVGAAGMFLRQPLIVAFIAVGILVGPAGLDVVSADAPMELLAALGISILLFLVGLRLDLNVIRTMGPVSLATGLGQVAFTSAIGYVICRALGIEPVASLYIAVALTFSSTIIIVKLLSDKREIDSLHGRIAVGFLIVQDIVVVLVMIGLSAFGRIGGGEGAGAEDVQETLLGQALLVLLRGLGFLAAIGLLMRYVLPRLTQMLARSQEMLILFAIAWAVFLAAVGDAIGLSKEVGAFLAGVSLASTPFRDSIGGRLVSLRDFLLLFFFIQLGTQLDLSLIGEQIGAASVLSLFVLIGNPLIVIIIMGAMGYRKRTGFLAGLTVAQISEFSPILGALGVTLGHIGDGTMGLITLVGLITIGLSTYLILYSHPIYERIAPLLSPFERKVAHRETEGEVECPAQVDAVIIGLGRFGSNIASGLRRRGMTVLGVDFDPQLVNAWLRDGHSAQYGDASDPEFPSSLPLACARWIVCTSPELQTNRLLMQSVRAHGYKGRIALTAHTSHDANALQECGADEVLLPFVDAADEAAERLAGTVDERG